MKIFFKNHEVLYLRHHDSYQQLMLEKFWEPSWFGDSFQHQSLLDIFVYKWGFWEEKIH